MSLLNKLKVGDDLPRSVISNVLLSSKTRIYTEVIIYDSDLVVTYTSCDYLMTNFYKSKDKNNYILLNYSCKNPLP
jgi:hypothetical protein